MKPVLYFSPGACSLAAHVVLEWTGEPYETVRIDLHDLDPDFLRINPSGAVPALVDGSKEPLTQCAAVLNYLALRHPTLDLLDDRSPEHAAQLVRWTAFLTGDLHPAFWPVFMPARYTTSAEPSAIESVKDAGLALVRAKLAILEAHLAGKRWIVGDKRTFVDAYALPMLNWATALLPDKASSFPNAMKHRAQMLADPGVARVMIAEGLAVK